jgi:hypothetical protein
MHAMSLNALALVLEEPSKAARPPDDHFGATTAPDAVDATVARALACLETLRKSISEGNERISPSNRTVPSSAEALPVYNASSCRDLLYDGSFGLRQRAESRSAIKKAETAIPLFSGFVSRDDITR